MQRIGIYPGTFDPLHQGHLSFAHEAAKAYRLDQVVFLPEPQPRAKVNVTPIEQRIGQIKTSIASRPILDVHHFKSSQFTISKTLPEIQKQFTSAKFTLLVGSDVALGLHKWSDIESLLAVCDIAVGMRSRETQDEINQQINHLRSLSPSTKFIIVKTNYSSLASSAFRS